MVIKHNQQGVVLVISLVFLIALTAVASVLMQNTTADIKMSGANQERMIAVQEAISATDELVFRQVKKIDGKNNFSQSAGAYSQEVIFDDTNTTAEINFLNSDGLDTGCNHMRLASSVGEFGCNVLRVQVVKRYGRSSNQRVTVNARVSQLFKD